MYDLVATAEATIAPPTSDASGVLIETLKPPISRTLTSS
jgi:hypothetical protein